MLWCIEKPHSVKAIDVSSHLIRKLGERARRYSPRLVKGDSQLISVLTFSAFEF